MSFKILRFMFPFPEGHLKCIFPQIAPAEAPDSKMRMVIVTGPPEAQFKVCMNAWFAKSFQIHFLNEFVVRKTFSRYTSQLTSPMCFRLKAEYTVS